jgi:hypothetical protein
MHAHANLHPNSHIYDNQQNYKPRTATTHTNALSKSNVNRSLEETDYFNVINSPVDIASDVSANGRCADGVMN